MPSSLLYQHQSASSTTGSDADEYMEVSVPSSGASQPKPIPGSRVDSEYFKL